MPLGKRTINSELEAFWRSHLKGKAASNLNQTEYCEAHGLPLKRFWNWHARFKNEMPKPVRRLLWRRGGDLSPGVSPGTREIPRVPGGYFPNGRTRRSMVMPASSSWLGMATSHSLPAGRTHGASSTTSIRRGSPIAAEALELIVGLYAIKRAIRSVAIGRKNHCFADAGSGAERWGIMTSLITTAKINDVEPYAYLKDVLERMTNGHPMNEIDNLLHWNWNTPNTVN